MNPRIDFIESELENLRENLKRHTLYKNLHSIKDVKVFMENHVFAVWDFMSLLKALQIDLTTVSTPWVPRENSKLARFINEITVAEESDFDKDGVVKSHFEMYLDAMQEVGADTSKIAGFIKQVSALNSVESCLDNTALLPAVKDFVSFTFNVINTKETHKIAAAFTFGREDVIPDMFLKIVEEAAINKSQSFDSFTYYLKRHIELDGDEHGPLSLQMITELCGDDHKKWDDVLAIAKESLTVRINLWRGIEKQLKNYKQEFV